MTAGVTAAIELPVPEKCGETVWMLRHLLGLGRDAVFRAGVRDHTLFVARRV